MQAKVIKNYFNQAGVVLDYARASVNVGLWNSEKIIIEKYLTKEQKILELGCGAGRIARAMYSLGYKNITASDFSEEMVKQASLISEDFLEDIDYRVLDATKLNLDDNSYEGAIFGFNGLMQIPKEKNRIKALKEINRILKKNSYFIFTTHDRKANKEYWQNNFKLWIEKKQDEVLDEFGDSYYEADYGKIFIHSPSQDEVKYALEKANFEIVFSKARSEISDEPECVRDFSDECLFWVVKK